SSLIHMVLGWHKGDFKVLKDEAGLSEAMRRFNIEPGDYLMPRAESMAAMGSPEFKARLAQGPNLFMTVRPNGMSSMGKMLGLWFGYSLIVSLFAAYVSGRALGQGADYLHVFRFAGVTAFSGYTLALWQGWVWWGKSLRYTLLSTFDGLIYALVTAGAFGWLWPR
ncbi:MAG TPA: hypothetical protein VG916_08840, partial [Gemmatimonadaceae bacterium]|nr:hypothetical protein [Gemmatimonadaceae bacterium]